MVIFKRILLTLVSPLFAFLLFATAFDVGFTRTATHPQAVKELVAKSGVYKTVIPNVLQQNERISTPLGDISTADPQVKNAITSAIPPQTVQQQGDAAIDNIYAWLDGKTAQPSFSFGIAGQKAQFADSVTTVVEQRLQSLPACSTAQSLAIARTGSFDALNATCLPKGVSAQAAAETVKAGILNSDYVDKGSFSAADIKDSAGRSVFQTKLKDAPKQYQRLKKSPFVLAVLTILAGLGVVFLSSNWRKGLRHAGVTVLFAGLLMLFFSWELNKVVGDNLPKLHIDNAVLQQSANGLVADIAHKITDNYRLFGIIYLALGIVAIIAGQVLIRRAAGETAAPKAIVQTEPSSDARRSEPPTESRR